MLVDEIVPRIQAVVARSVKLVGCEDVEDGARLLWSPSVPSRGRRDPNIIDAAGAGQGLAGGNIQAELAQADGAS